MIYKSPIPYTPMNKENFKVTPWEVEGKVDYDKLIQQFGTKKLDEN